LCGGEKWTLQEVDQNYIESFWNVVLEKDGEDQMDWSCEKWRSSTQS
jgi:mRNA deadenylase 3'-5' endonuclease subunit Ccr4